MTKSLFSDDAKQKAQATREDVIAFCIEQGLPENDGVYLFHHWMENGWSRNNKPLKSWRQAILAWKAGGYLPSQRAEKSQRYTTDRRHDSRRGEPGRREEPAKKCIHCGKAWKLNEIGSWVYQCSCFGPVLGNEPF